MTISMRIWRSRSTARTGCAQSASSWLVVIVPSDDNSLSVASSDCSFAAMMPLIIFFSPIHCHSTSGSPNRKDLPFGRPTCRRPRECPGRRCNGGPRARQLRPSTHRGTQPVLRATAGENGRSDRSRRSDRADRQPAGQVGQHAGVCVARVDAGNHGPCQNHPPARGLRDIRASPRSSSARRIAPLRRASTRDAGRDRP